eukprot:m.254594 g.254594  ORF g.254594 m.254594 type:complete len:1056 (-) comp33919_c0_seq1:113-3280(-)
MKGYGAHFITTEWNYGSEDDYISAKENGSPLPRTSVGQIQATGVAFHDFGKLGMEHRSFHINYLHEYLVDDVENILESCVFVDSWNDAIVVGQSPAVRFTNNIVHKTLGLGVTTGDPLLLLNWESRAPAGFDRTARRRRTMSVTVKDFGKVVGGADHVVDDNLVTASFHYPAESLNEHIKAMWHSGMLLRQPMKSMKRNIVSGAAHGGISWVLQGTHDQVANHTALDNEAYASYYGAIVRGNKRTPNELFRLKAWRNGESGVVAFDETQDLQFREVVLADNKYGASVSFTSTASLEVRRCVIIGNSDISSNTGLNECPSQVGITLPIYTTKPGPRCDKMFGPCKDCSVEGSAMSERFGNTNTGLMEEFYVESTVFTHFGSGACLEAKGIHLHPTSPDYSPDVYLDRIRWHSTVAKNRRFRLGDTSGTHEGCSSEASCDAVNHLKLFDGDGSTIGDFWGAGSKVEGVRNTVLYSSNFPQVLREDKCRAHADSMSIMCTDYPLTTVSIDVPPQCNDGCKPVKSISVHKYDLERKVNKSYFTVGAFEQSCSCQKHIMGGSFPVEPSMMYDFDLPVVDDLNLPGQYLPQFVPPNTRMTFHSADPTECILVRLYMQKSKPVTIIVNSRVMNDVKLLDGSTPTVNSAPGTNVMLPLQRRLYVTMCGSGEYGYAEYLLRVEERVQVTVAINMDFSEFYAEEIPDLQQTPLENRVALFQRTFGLDRMVNNFALLLNIPMDNIKIACVHEVGQPCIPLELMLATGGYNPSGRNRRDRHARAAGGTAIELEIVPLYSVNETGNETLYQENVEFLETIEGLLNNASESTVNNILNETVGAALNQTVQGNLEAKGEFGNEAVDQGAVSFPTSPPTANPTKSPITSTAPTSHPTPSPSAGIAAPLALTVGEMAAVASAAAVGFAILILVVVCVCVRHHKAKRSNRVTPTPHKGSIGGGDLPPKPNPSTSGRTGRAQVVRDSLDMSTEEGIGRLTAIVGADSLTEIIPPLERGVSWTATRHEGDTTEYNRTSRVSSQLNPEDLVVTMAVDNMPESPEPRALLHRQSSVA